MAIYKVQASGVMFRVLSPAGWAFVFGIHVTDQDGIPVTNLQESDFSVFDLNNFSDLAIGAFSNIGVDLPFSNLKGIYRVQTKIVLGTEVPAPQQFLFALKAGITAEAENPEVVAGETTVAITYLGGF